MFYAPFRSHLRHVFAQDHPSTLPGFVCWSGRIGVTLGLVELRSRLLEDQLTLMSHLIQIGLVIRKALSVLLFH